MTVIVVVSFFAFFFQVHLFDIDVPGKIRFQESEVLSPGQQLTMMNTCKLRIFPAYCNVGFSLIFSFSFNHFG